jgi:hypothetical protein
VRRWRKAIISVFRSPPLNFFPCNLKRLFIAFQPL